MHKAENPTKDQDKRKNLYIDLELEFWKKVKDRKESADL